MSFYSALVGYDLRQAGIKQSGASHFMAKAIVLTMPDLQFESTSSYAQASAIYGVTDVQFYMFDYELVILLYVDLYYYYDQQVIIQETQYFHTYYKLSLSPDAQMITFSHAGKNIEAQVVITELSLQKVVRFPLVEINIADFQLSRSQCYVSNFFGLEIQAGPFKCLKHFGGRQGDLSVLSFPFYDEILVKLEFVVKFFELQHRFTLANAKISLQQGVSKATFLKIVDFNPQLDPTVLALVDTILLTIQQGTEEWKDLSGASVKLNSILTPGFLNRWLMVKNPKLQELNTPQFGHPPHLIDSDNKKLKRMLQSELVACEDMTYKLQPSDRQAIAGSLFFFVESSFIPKEQPPDLVFTELQKIHKSIAILTTRLLYQSEGFGFVVLANKEIARHSLAQEFEVGSGNLAVCKPAEYKDFLVAMHRGNQTATIKLLANSTKSLIKTSAAGITIQCLIYEKGRDFITKVISYSQEQLKTAIEAGQCVIDTSLSSFCVLRLYFYDLIYQEKKQISELPKLPGEQSGYNMAAEADGSVSARPFAAQSIIPAINFALPQSAVLDVRQTVDYFGGRSATFFIVQPQRALLTFYDSLDDEQRRIKEEYRRIEEERRIYELERYRQEEEARKALEQKLEAERLAAYQAEEMKKEQGGDQPNDIKAFHDNRRKEMDEKRRKMEEEKREREEKEKEEMRRKMELKKLRNLKWQQQIQRFIVDERGKIDTFYNDKMDQQERNARQREFQYPRKEVRTIIRPKKQPETIYVCNGGETQQPVQKSPGKSKQRSTSEIYAKRAASSQESALFGPSDEAKENILNMDSLQTKQLLITPIPCMRNTPPNQPTSSALRNLQNSPLNRSSRKQCRSVATYRERACE